MATYKVIQDVEAEDKFIGPLTLRQFIFAMGGVFFGYMNFFVLTKGALWAMIIFLPPMLFGFFMAIPWSKDQPTDVWVLAKLRFRFGSKKRIWDQAGMQELVTITAPKKIEKVLTNNLSQTEVKSRLKALAETIDSRGWAIKNASIQDSLGSSATSDRLVDAAVLPTQTTELEADAAKIPDMMENASLDSLIQEHGNQRKTQITEQMSRLYQGKKLENKSGINISPPSDQIPSYGAENVIDEKLLSEEIKAKKTAGDIAYNRMSHISAHPAKAKKPKKQNDAADDDDANDNKKTGVKKATSSMTDTSSPDILNLAQNNDLDVATIARQASNDKSDDNEVVISLH